MSELYRMRTLIFVLFAALSLPIIAVFSLQSTKPSLANQTWQHTNPGWLGVGSTPSNTYLASNQARSRREMRGENGLVTIRQSALEIVSDNTLPGDGGNAWGGHQSRIVRTKDGVFTTYSVEGSDYLTKEWRLAWRQGDGNWVVAAQGIGGREPVNLLASPDGTLHVIGWPTGIGTIWSGKPLNGSLIMTPTVIPGVAEGNWPYGAAGIDNAGDLCVLNTNEIYENGATVGGAFDWACWLAESQQWVGKRTEFDYRYAYTYVFPKANGNFSLVATRDVRWEQLGYSMPEGAFAYVFNAFRYWHSNDWQNQPLEVKSFAEELPTEKSPYVFLDAQMDAYLDSQSRMHILYVRNSEATGGVNQIWQRIVARDGTLLYDAKLADEVGYQLRIFEDPAGNLYLLSGSEEKVFPIGKDGTTVSTPYLLDFDGYDLAYTGPFVTVPRGGNPISNQVDVVFPTEDEKKWIYFRLDLLQDEPATANLIENGDFAHGDSGWHGGLAMSNWQGLTVQEGQLCLEIPAEVTSPADAQMAQYGIRLQQGEHYRVNFEMKADRATTVKLMIGESQEPWTHDLERDIALSTEPQTFSYAFTMQRPTDLNSLLTFHLGGQPASLICLDNVEVRKEQRLWLPVIEH